MNFVIGNSSWRAWQTLRPPVPCCNFLYIWIGWLHHVYSANTPTLQLQACNSPLVVQASVGVNDCGTWDMDGWMIALFSPFFHPQDYKSSHCCNQLALQWHRSTPSYASFLWSHWYTKTSEHKSVILPHKHHTKWLQCQIQIGLPILRVYSYNSCNNIWIGCSIGILHISN